MFGDMSLSDQLQDEYKKQSHQGSPGGVEHECRVLQTNAWPEKPDDINIVPCAEMLACISAFKFFYDSKHNGLKLQWMYNMGQVELKALSFSRPHILAVSAYQCLVLMLFNKTSQISFKEICDATKVPPEECKRHVQSLTVSRHKLLSKSSVTGGESKEIEDDTRFAVNLDFTNEKMKVVVGLIKKEEKAEQIQVAETPVERKHVIDAAVVRIMKSRKKLDHNSLLEEVYKQCTLFKPQPSQIKVQVEHLIDREFLKRDGEKRNVYIYLP
jgi:cullin 3